MFSRSLRAGNIMSLGKDIPHDSSYTHVTGESQFIDDRPLTQKEIYVGVLGSPITCGKINNIDFTEALKLPGVLGGYTRHDLKSNIWGAIFKEQPILAFEKVMYRGEPIALIAVENEEIILQALKLIKVDSTAIKPVLLLDQAIKNKDFIYKANSFKQGDFSKAYKNSSHKLSEIFECGGQEHFYLESHASLAYPLEQGQIEVHSSSQHPTETQHVVAEALGIS